ncbi:MAG: hypothetical protein K6E51_00645 [Treponema sp.]|nr:hypothetical protein [Treponema sp.]
MPTIAQHIDEIRNLDVENHKIDKIRKRNWDALNYPEKDALHRAIFTTDEITLTRGEVKAETDIKTKIMKVLMWGYQTPSGTPPQATFEDIANHLTKLEAIFSRIQNQNLNAAQLQEVYNNMCDIQGLGKYGMATKAKLLYFFNVSFEGKKCLILDSKVVKNLNRFDDFPGTEWAANQKCYPNYLSLMDELAMIHNVSSEQLEMFLFRYKE